MGNNGCENMDGGKMVIFRKDEEKHLLLECPYRTESCLLCGEEGRYSDITGSHLQSCPGVEIECPNNGCQESVKRKDISTHKKTCKYELVACRYADVGCDIKMARKDAPVHEGDVKLHLSIVVTYARKLQTDKLPQAHAEIQALHAKLKTVVECMKSNFESLYSEINSDKQPHLPTTVKQQTQVTFKLSDYHSYAESEVKFYSPLFYTSPGGYKMCVSASATTDHLSTYIYLMRGENDDNLTWPFQSAKIKIELLNQRENSAHHSHTVSYDEDSGPEVMRRVTDGERGTGWGWKNFYSYAN